MLVLLRAHVRFWLRDTPFFCVLAYCARFSAFHFIRRDGRERSWMFSKRHFKHTHTHTHSRLCLPGKHLSPWSPWCIYYDISTAHDAKPAIAFHRHHRHVILYLNGFSILFYFIHIKTMLPARVSLSFKFLVTRSPKVYRKKKKKYEENGI